MEKGMIEILDITNVYQIRTSKWFVEIYFTVENFEYSLTLKEVEGTYVAWVVCHEDTYVCPVCNVATDLSTSMTCRFLHEHRRALFKRLVEHPAIRLEWLYLPYVEV